MWEVLPGPLCPDPERLLQSSLVSLSLPDGKELLGEKWGPSAERGLLNRERPEPQRMAALCLLSVLAGAGLCFGAQGSLSSRAPHSLLLLPGCLTHSEASMGLQQLLL